MTIPGKYVGEDGEYTVLLSASDGESGEKTVIYRKGDHGPVYTLSAEKWCKKFRCAEDIALAHHLRHSSRTEFLRRFTSLFSGRTDVCSVHWRTVFAYEGYNYFCENHNLARGCMFGTDNCKNCRSRKLVPYSETIAELHLSKDKTIGVYPIIPGDGCRFSAIENLSGTELSALRRVCRSLDIPSYGESFMGSYRLWFFFSEAIAAKDARMLTEAVITRAIDENADISFELYEKMIPIRGALAKGSFGKPVILPLGKFRRSESVFVDDALEPLPEGAAAIFGFRTITRSYLADRLAALGAADFGPSLQLMTELPPEAGVTLAGGIAIQKSRVEPKTLAALKRQACLKLPEKPLEEFIEPTPTISVCFREDREYLYLPRGMWAGLKTTASAVDKRIGPENCCFSFAEELTGEEYSAAKALLERSEGIIIGPPRSGKTEITAYIISALRSRTLLLTADEVTRRRWVDNVLRYLGTDAEKPESRIDVRLITDENIKDKYGLIILADCSRVPMNHEIFSRLSALSPLAFYGITADNQRYDGLWDYIRLLCGDIVYRLNRQN
ncbi:MAG: hypothetical protein J1F63_07975 [Oscillospiraceae bacterium]|nr:hypothetical protein [Oscillospiraceae bacterium]